VLKFIENRWGLAPLGTRDAAANDLTNAFDFGTVPGLPNTGGGAAATVTRYTPLLGLVAVLVTIVPLLMRRRARRS
jgi:hypothetical protein